MVRFPHCFMKNTFRSTRLAALALASVFSIPLFAADDTKPVVEQISKNVFQIGLVRMDKAARTVRFPAKICMTDGWIEYLVVTEKGKTHESLLLTAAQPQHIQVAMILLNAKGLNSRPFPEKHTEPIPGEQVEVQIFWKDEKEKSARAESFVENVTAKAPMTKGPFVFNGSRIQEGQFIAQRDGSILSLITDQDALFNNPRPGRENDENWKVLAKGLPPLNTAVIVEFRLPPLPKPVEKSQ